MKCLRAASESRYLAEKTIVAKARSVHRLLRNASSAMFVASGASNCGQCPTPSNMVKLRRSANTPTKISA
jgi:hypothetical protein